MQTVSSGWAEDRIPLKPLFCVSADDDPRTLNEEEMAVVLDGNAIRDTMLCGLGLECELTVATGDGDLYHTPFQRTLIGIQNSSEIDGPVEVTTPDLNSDPELTVDIMPQWVQFDSADISPFESARSVLLNGILESQQSSTNKGVLARFLPILQASLSGPRVSFQVSNWGVELLRPLGTRGMAMRLSDIRGIRVNERSLIQP